MRLMIAALGLVLVLGPSVWAGTDCDNQYLYPKVFCDSFDTYCNGTETNPCQGNRI